MKENRSGFVHNYQQLGINRARIALLNPKGCKETGLRIVTNDCYRSISYGSGGALNSSGKAGLRNEFFSTHDMFLNITEISWRLLRYG